MFYYKIKISYDGGNYHGWQDQPGFSTVQSTIKKALLELSAGEIVGVQASGRTDAGVHALGQVVRIALDREISLQQLNGKLPTDIRCLDLVSCPKDFKVDMDLQSKEYSYLFNDQLEQHPYIANYPYKLDLELIKRGCRLIEGEHDFALFSSSSDALSTVREIFSCQLDSIKFGDKIFGMELPEHHQLTFQGKGFLKYMVRYLVGALFKVGRGEISLEQFEQALKGSALKRLPLRLSRPAPANGLYLSKVEY